MVPEPAAVLPDRSIHALHYPGYGGSLTIQRAAEAQVSRLMLIAPCESILTIASHVVAIVSGASAFRTVMAPLHSSDVGYVRIAHANEA